MDRLGSQRQVSIAPTTVALPGHTWSPPYPSPLPFGAHSPERASRQTCRMIHQPQKPRDGHPRQQSPVHLFLHHFKWGGGIERYGMDVSTGIRDLGRTVQVHARKVDPQVAARLAISAQAHPVWAFPRRLRTWTLYRRIERLLPRLEGLQIALATVPARDVVVCAGTHLGYLKHLGRKPGFFDRLQIRVENASYHSSRRVVSFSRLCADELVDLYRIPRERVTVLYPPIGNSFTPASDPSQRQRHRRDLGLPEDRTVILFPSTGHRRKGLDPICEALAGLQDPPLLAIAGKPPGRQREQLRLKDGRPAPVQFLGYIEDMEAAYRAADFTILGSFYEPFGMVGAESVLCGTRLLFEERAGCLEAVDPGVVETFSVHDVETIRRAMRQAVDLAHGMRHRIEDPGAALRYDPRPTSYARALLALAEG